MSIIDKFLKRQTTVKSAEENEMPDTIIEELIKSLENATDWRSAKQIISLVKEGTPNFDEYKNNCYHYKDYFIQVAPRFAIKNHAHGLERVKNLGLSIAPELIKYCDLGESGVLITQISGTEGELAVPYDENSSLVTLKAKKQLLKDIDTLTDHNFIVLQLNARDDWQYFAKAEKIVVSDWRSQYIKMAGDEAAKIYHKKRVTQLLGLNAES